MRRGIKEFGALMELFPILTGDMVTRCMHLSKFNFVLKLCKYLYMGFPGDSMVKNLPAIAGDMGSIRRSRRSSGEEMATHSGILAWRIPWTEKPTGLQSIGWQTVGHD